MPKGYVVTILADYEVSVGTVYTERSQAEVQLGIVRALFADRYGEDGFEDYGDDDEVAVLDGPTARLHEVDLADSHGNIES